MKFKLGILPLSLFLAMAGGNASAEVMVHMFQWKFNDVANECEKVLGPKGFTGVQITPPAEHLKKPEVWWSVYQPVNLANFNSFGGTEAELRSMITRCNAAGVKIYADAVFNNWASYNGGGVATGGDSWSTGSYPRFSNNDFHGNCSINSYGDRYQVQNCRLSGMPDLNTGSDYVQNEVATYMKTLVGWGVAGFRIDAAKHMSTSDLGGILGKAGNPKVYMEVIGADGEAVQPGEYTGLGYVTEFKYTSKIKEQFNGQIKNLKTFGESWGMLSSGKAQVFVTNHDNERGSAGTTALTYKDGDKYYLANTFMLAWPYGWPQVLSSYKFNGHDDGAPSSAGCGDGWVCQQRNPLIMNMALFHNKTLGQSVTNWWDNGNNQIAFGRGNKGFVVINKEGGSINQSFQTGMAAGEYCQILAGNDYCSGSYVTVDGSGKASFSVGGMKAAAIVEGCTKADSSGCGGKADTGGSGGGTDSGGGTSTDPVAKFTTMNFRGTTNSWASTPMTVDAKTRIWSVTVDFTGQSDTTGAQRFKFDVSGNWAENYGDNEADGKADKNSQKDIYFTGTGKYTVSLKESDMSYTITAAGSSTDTGTGTGTGTGTDTGTGTGTAKFASMNYRGTTNGWTSTAMTVDSNRIWSTIVDFTGKSDTAGAQRFKFDVFGNWTENYGDNEADGKADKNSKQDIYFTGVGKYKVALKESDMSYTVTQITENQAPKAVVAPATITVKQGEQVVFDASSSSDDNKVTGYSWSTGGTGKTETVTFDNVGTQKVVLTVSDADGATASATATVIVEEKPNVPTGYLSNFKQLSYRGTSNSWAAKAMELVADNTWQTTVTFSGVKNERFKIDSSDNLTEAYGDRNDDGKLELNAVIYPGYKGTFTLTVNDETMTYTLKKQGDAYASNLSSLYYSAPESGSWQVQPMKLVANNTWYIRVKLNGVDKQRFRFDKAGKGVKSQLLGDSDKNGVADAGGLPIYQSGKGYYIIKLNDSSMKYSVVAQ